MTTMEYPQIDLYEFLTESELQHYYNAIKNELKITNAAQFKYATDEDLKNIGLSRPEIRRLRKYYEKHFPHGYLSKIKRLLQAPTTMVKRDEANSSSSNNGLAPGSGGGNTSGDAGTAAAKANNSPSKAPNNKHIIPADAISVNKQLGTGEFGIVQQGVWTNGTERIQVAIKCLCRERMQSNPMEFLKEAAIMHSIEHENIVRLYGVVLATDSLMLVTELAHLRSLLECLKDSGLRVSFLTIPTLCEFAMQICNGMRYLENKRLIHRDLAARNILVFSKNKVKISDFGLSRALGVGKDYYKTNFNVNLKLPIAWCAPECINYLRFTNASDVWAFGVCLWEMFSYGFQPWAALTGLQILEAIDSPNCQRLEQPECCPSEYYTLMMKCWQDDPLKRPRFSEIYEQLPDMKPEQLKAVVNQCEPKKDHLMYRQGDIITVLDRNTGTPYWKGVLSTGKTGYFNPSNTVTFLEGLPSSNRDSFCRVSERSSKRKLRTEMISKPQNDFKHTGHVGIDGASFGDIAFLSSSQSIVTPYKPSEDIEQTPLLLPPTPTSPDSLQTASGYFADGGATSMNPSFVSSTENTPKHIAHGGQTSFEFPQATSTSTSTNPFTHDEPYPFAMHNNNYSNDGGKHDSWRNPSSSTEEPHEYHEISDDEITADKLDFGPSLLDEINSMFGSISGSSSAQQQQPKSPDFDHVNIKNEFAEITSKLVGGGKGDSNGNKFGTSSKSKKNSGSGHVKQISVKDEKILNHAIEIANEISARSMIDLVSDQSHASAAQSPKRKFSFRFPHLSSNGGEKSHHGLSHGGSSGNGGQHGSQPHGGASSPYSKKKNFTEELKSIPDLQAIIGEEGREAYNSLIERKSSLGGGELSDGGLSPSASLLRHLDTNEFDMQNSKTLPRCSIPLRNSSEQFASSHLALHPQQNHHHQQHHTQNEDQQLHAIPLQNAPRPMTLPTRGAANRGKKVADLCGAGDLLGKQLMQRAQGKENSDQNGNQCNGNGLVDAPGDGKLSPCESPSYMTNTFYSFPEQKEKQQAGDEQNSEANPLPLPSREGKKHIKTNAKRHVRKYPLIIPANGLQRTLNKLTDVQSDGGGSPQQVRDQQNLQGSQHKPLEVVASMRAHSNALSSKLRHQTEEDALHTYQNLDQIDSGGNQASNVSSTDTASLQFESILEADSNKGNVLQSPDVTDGFYSFSIQKEHYNKSKEVTMDANKISGLYVNEDELRNLDMERSVERRSVPETTTKQMSESEERSGVDPAGSKLESTLTKPTTTTTMTKTVKADNELAGNALFKKVRETVDMAMSRPVVASESSLVSSSTDKEPENVPKELTTAACSSSASGVKQRTGAQTEAEYFAATATRLADSNSVSCEDLLEFSDKKPKGCERGVDSDEVRIMVKVLGKASTPERCLHVLEFINWDVHKAIKLIKLQNILSGAELSLSESHEVLQKYDWDLHVTAIKLRGLKT